MSKHPIFPDVTGEEPYFYTIGNYTQAVEEAYEAEQVGGSETKAKGTVLPNGHSSLRAVHGNLRTGIRPQVEEALYRNRRRANGRRASMPALPRKD